MISSAALLLLAWTITPMPDKPFEIDGFERSEVKRAFYTMVNAPSWDSARRAIWQHSKRWKELMPAIARKHSAVEDALCSGIGAQLMFIDATIMCRNLNREGIVALPIHDSDAAFFAVLIAHPNRIALCNQFAVKLDGC